MENRVLTWAEVDDKYDQTGHAAGNTESDVDAIAAAPDKFTEPYADGEHETPEPTQAAGPTEPLSTTDVGVGVAVVIIKSRSPSSSISPQA